MPVQPPKLDQRSLVRIVQQLLDEADDAFTAAPVLPPIPRWGLAQHLSEQEVRALLARPFDDPGLMLALIYARLLELTLQRLNLVPEKNLLAFLDTMGVGLLPPAPAHVPLVFGLTPGTPATRVPRGTQAASQPSGTQAAVVFETEDDLTVVPALLAPGFTIDPTWDRYADQTSRLDGSNPFGFTPFVGTTPLPHVLHLGDGTLLDFARAASVQLEFRWSGPATAAEVQGLLRRLAYRYRVGGALKTVVPSSVNVTTNQARLQFTIPEPIELETVAGVGLGQGVSGRWLRAALARPFPDEPVARSLKLSNVLLPVSASGLQPELAFANTAPLDLSTDFLPFGENPKVGDAFYLASAEAFAKPGVRVTLNLDQQPLPPPTLRWEYFRIDPGQAAFRGWQPLLVVPARDSAELDSLFNKLARAFFDVPFIVDSTASFTRDGELRGLALHLGQTSHNGIRAFWVRLRLVGGGYNLPPSIAQLLVAGQNEVRPPDVGFANATVIDFDRPFLPFGTAPSAADLFAFGKGGNGFPIINVNDRSVASLNLSVKLDPDPKNVPAAAELRWEYAGPSGWTELPDLVSTTPDLKRSGTVSFKVPDAAQREVNGQASYWIRTRLISGGYGEPAQFEAVDPDDPKQGFRLRTGTGAVQPPRIRSISLDYQVERTPTILTQNGFLFDQPGGSFAPFVSVRELTPAIYADPEPAFYLGFDAAFPERPISLYVAAAPRAFAGGVVRGARPAPAPSSALPPLRWEYFDGAGWSELTVFDGTTSLTESGAVKFLSPPDLAPLAKFDLTARYWVRARSVDNDPFDTQRLQGVFLNATSARQAVSVRDETIGSSNAQPSQQLRLARPPVLPGQQVLVREPEPPAEQERAAIEAEEGPDAVQERINAVTGAPEIWVRWHEVTTFLRSDPRSRHYLLDHASGLLSFGDGRRGLIPPPGTNNVSASYASGGGTGGNLPKGAVGKIQTPLPGLATVANPVAADGGAAQETVDQVKQRGPWTLRHRQRGVAAGDLEWLAREAAGTQVARVRVLPNVNRDLRFEPGWTTLLLVPRGTEARLSPSPELIRQVRSFLQARAFVGLAAGTPARVNVIGPGYLQVVVAAQVVPFDVDDAEVVEGAAITALDAFFHPLTGGPRGTGWEFARDVYESEISQVLEGVVGVSHVKTLDLLPNQAQHRLFVAAAPTVSTTLPAGSLVGTTGGRKAALLAEPAPAGLPLTSLAVKGFREGDRLARVRDLAGSTPGPPIVEAGGVIPTINVSAFPADPVGFPRGSRLATLDGRLQTRLARAIPRAPAGGGQLLLTSIAVESQDFVAGLRPLEQLTVFYPFPLVVTAVTLEAASGRQTLTIEPYQAEVEFPAGSLLASLDNRARLPLAEPLAAGGPTTSIRLEGFQAGEQLTLSSLPGSLTIQRVDQLTDVVYLDDNFLVQPGRHRITMRAD